MLLLRKPTEQDIARFIREQAELDFSYAEEGATQHAVPAGYDSDHVRVVLGRGEAAFDAAIAAFREWRQFRTSWTSIHSSDTPVEAGRTVAVLARALGVWSLNACRIIYVVDEQGAVERFGFGYGTLPGHSESGEERFLIEWNRECDEVFYDVVAFFRPRHPLVRLSWLYATRRVNRFRRDSAEAMRAAVRQAID